MIRVLLVEDNAAHARLVHEMLKENDVHRFEYRRVDSLGAAIRLLQDEPFHVVLLDLGLPDAFGPEAVVRLRSAAPHVPIVVLSALPEESFPLRAAQLGAQEFLVKGEEDAEQLLRAIKDSIERGRVALGADQHGRPVTVEGVARRGHGPSAVPAKGPANDHGP